MLPHVDPITPYFEPKPAGGVRTMARLSARDQEVWSRLAVRIAETTEPMLASSVLANRTIPAATRIRFRPLGTALRRARRLADRLANHSDVVIRTDIRSFYPSISPRIVHDTLTGLGVERAVAKRVSAMLEVWGSEGYSGLPIGPPGSAVVANAILRPVDMELDRWLFLRWVDDYLIGMWNGSETAEVLERVDTSLSRLGLERSEAKTSLREGGSSLLWPGTYAGPRSR